MYLPSRDRYLVVRGRAPVGYTASIGLERKSPCSLFLFKDLPCEFNDIAGDIPRLP